MKSGRTGSASTHEIHAHRIAAEREERAVAERENAAIAPHEIERDRQDRIAEIFAEQRYEIGRQMQGETRRRQREHRHEHRSRENEKHGDAQPRVEEAEETGHVRLPPRGP